MNPNTFRILTAPKGQDLRATERIAIAYTTGDKRTAVHSAIKDIEAMGDGARFIVQKYDGYRWNEWQCGEWLYGRWLPRNNY